MPQYKTRLFYMYVLNGCQRLDAVVVVSSKVVKIDGAVVWLFIVAAAACRKLVPSMPMLFFYRVFQCTYRCRSAGS